MYVVNLSTITLHPANKAYHVDVSKDLEERRARVRKLMRERNVKVLIIEKSMDGNDLWLNDTTPMAIPTPGLVIMTENGLPRLMEGYNVLEEGRATQPQSWMLHFTTVDFINGLSAQDIREALGDTKRLGITYSGSMRASVYEYLERKLPDVELVDLTDDLEMEKAAKSAAELEIMQYVAAAHDKIFSALPSMLVDGRYERDVVQQIRHTAYLLGSGGFGVFYSAMVDMRSHQPGETVPEGGYCYPGRALHKGDLVQVKVQAHMLNGYYGVLGRCYCLGQPEEATVRKHQVSVMAADAIAAQLIPGNTLRQAADAGLACLAEQGLQTAEPMVAYGTGATYAEPPILGNTTEDFPLRDGMVLAVGVPVCAGEGDEPVACWDAYVVRKGGAVRMSALPRDIIRI